MQLRTSALQTWTVAIEDQSALLLNPEARHKYLLWLVMQARKQDVGHEQISDMLEVTDSALLWANEEVSGRLV